MSINSEMKQFPYGRYLLRGFAMFLIFMLIKTLMLFSTILAYTDNGGNFQGVPQWAAFAIVALGDLFVLNSVIYRFSYHDKRVLTEFLGYNRPRVRFFEEMRSIISSREFLTETGAAFFLAFLFALGGSFPEFSSPFAPLGAPEALLSALEHIFIYPIIFIISLRARYEARRRWHMLDHTGRLEHAFSTVKLIAVSIVILFGYPLLFPYAPIIILSYLSIFGVLGYMVLSFNVKSFLIGVLIVFAIIALIISFLALRSLRSRKKLIKRLREVAASSEYELSDIRRPYASLFKPIRECSFTLKRDGKVFSCRFIGSFWQRAPMFFVSDKHAHYLHRIGTRDHHFDFLSEFNYDFEGEGEKIIILNPVPKKAFVTKGSLYVEVPWYDSDKAMSAIRGTEYTNSSRLKKKSDDDVKRLEPGDKIWNYTIYNTTTFIGAVDRKCLGRSNGMFE